VATSGRIRSLRWLPLVRSSRQRSDRCQLHRGDCSQGWLHGTWLAAPSALRQRTSVAMMTPEDGSARWLDTAASSGGATQRLGEQSRAEQRGGGDMARERSKLGFGFDPRKTKIRAAVKLWAGARGWRAVAKPPQCHRACMGARWLGHTAMGHRGLLASGPCHLNFSLNFIISTNFVIQIGDLPNVQNSPNFTGRQFET
jgi:hypothetical protein